MTLAKFAGSLLLVVSYGLAVHAQDLSQFFKGITGAFVVYDTNHHRTSVTTWRVAVKGFSPQI